MRWYLPDTRPIFFHEVRRRYWGRRRVLLLVLAVGIVLMVILQQLVPMLWGLSYGISGFYFLGQRFASLLVLALAPALSAGLISAERERGSLELLFLTPLTSRQIVLQKYAGAILPLLALAAVQLLLALVLRFFFFFDQWYRSITSIQDSLLRILTLVHLFSPIITVLCYCAIGIYVSSLSRNTRTAMIVTYAIVVVGLSIMLPVLQSFYLVLSAAFGGDSSVTPFIYQVMPSLHSALLVAITICCLLGTIRTVSRLRGEYVRPAIWQYTGTGLKKPQEG